MQEYFLILNANLQAESAIAALNCSGVVLRSLPIRSAPCSIPCFSIMVILITYMCAPFQCLLFDFSGVFRVSPSKTPVRPRAPRPPLYGYST